MTRGIEFRDTRTRRSQPCPQCGGLDCAVRYEFRNGHLFRDTWTCACGKVVYHWEWASTMIAAQECRAMEPAPVAAPIFEPTVVDPRAKKQMRLF